MKDYDRFPRLRRVLQSAQLREASITVAELCQEHWRCAEAKIVDTQGTITVHLLFAGLRLNHEFYFPPHSSPTEKRAFNILLICSGQRVPCEIVEMSALNLPKGPGIQFEIRTRAITIGQSIKIKLQGYGQLFKIAETNKPWFQTQPLFQT